MKGYSLKTIFKVVQIEFNILIGSLLIGLTYNYDSLAHYINLWVPLILIEITILRRKPK